MSVCLCARETCLSRTDMSRTQTSLSRHILHSLAHQHLLHTDKSPAIHVSRDPSSPAPSHTDMSRAHSLAHRHLSRDACCTRPLISCPLAHRQVSASLLLSLSLPLTLSLVLSFLPHAATFLDGYCSTVQDLLDWFEVDLGFTKLYLFR